MMRISWGFLYWNFRKTVYRAKPDRVPCPCQNLSDSGRPGETGCDAVIGYANPKRFRMVCPLLKENADGKMKCSVVAAEVKPFWGRVIILALIIVMGSYASVVGGVYTMMKRIGYPVTVKMIALPTEWSQIDQARAAYFLRKAEQAYQAANLNEAVMALSLAYEYDPTNYDAGLSLAKLWQTSRPDVSNVLYQRLLAEHPEHQRRTAQTWLRALLPRRDFSAIERLAASALTFDPDFVAAWIHALLFANERTGNSEVLTQLLARSDTLPPGVREVLALETEVRSRPVDYARRLFGSPPPDGVPGYVVFYQLRRLISIGGAPRALELIPQLASRLSDRDRIALQLRALSQVPSRRSDYESLINQLLSLAPSLNQLEVISAQLINYPDLPLHNRVQDAIDPMNLATPGDQVAGLMCLFTLAAAHQDQARMEEIATVLRQETGSRFGALDAARAMVANPERVRIDMVLPTLQPLSLDMVYAMLSRFENQAP